MDYQSGFSLSEEKKEKVKKFLNEQDTELGSISHIVCESEMDIGAFFEHEIDREELLN